MVSTFQLTRTARLTGAPESTEKREGRGGRRGKRRKEKKGPRRGQTVGPRGKPGVGQGLCVCAFQSRSREHLGGRVCLRVDDKRSV
jgi:hypothetical protein